MEAVLAAYRSQNAHLRFIADNLPTYLPGPQSAAAAGAAAEAGVATHAQGVRARHDHAESATGGDENVSHNAVLQRPASAEAGADRKKRLPAPRR
jgi:hypothetical protein